MKRLLFAFVAVIMLTVAAAPTLAHGLYHGGTGTARYAVCAAKNCDQTGLHTHDGAYCFGHTVNNGHGYHHRNAGWQ